MHGFGFGPGRRRNRNGVSPYWQHDFTAGALPSGLTLTRASIGTRSDASGALTSEAIDAARFNYSYDATNGLWVPKGILIEPQRTNLETFSTLVSAFYTQINGAAITDNAAVALDGTSTAGLVSVSGTLVPGVYNLISVTPGVTYTMSCYAELGTMAASDYKFAVYDDTNKAFIGIDLVPTETPVISRYVKCQFTFTVPAGCDIIRLYPFRSSTPVAGTVAADGVQLEVGDYSTARIATSGAAATRHRDILSGSLATIIPVFDATKGTFVVSADALIGGAATRDILSIDDGTVNNRIRLHCSGGNVVYTVTSGGVDQASITVARAQGFKAAVRWAANDFQMAVNGTLGTADTSGLVPTGLTTLRLGCGATAGNELGGTIASLAYYPVLKTNSELQGLAI